MTRRDKVYLVGKRAMKLSRDEAVSAWDSLALSLEAMGAKDIPKFEDLLQAIRVATIEGKRDL